MSRLQVGLDLVAQLHDLRPLLEQRQYRDLVRGELGMEGQRDALLATDLLLAVGVDQERERRAVRAAGGLDDPRDEALARWPGRSTRGSRRSPSGGATGRSRRGCGCPRAPSSRTGSGTRCRSPSWRSGRARPGACSRKRSRSGGDAVARVPGPAPRAATPRRCARPRPGGTKYCISICSNSRIRNTKLPGLISLRKHLPIWAMPNGSFLRDRLLDVLEVDVRALGRLRAEVDDRGVFLDRAHERLEHEVEAARRPTAGRRPPGT